MVKITHFLLPFVALAVSPAFATVGLLSGLCNVVLGTADNILGLHTGVGLGGGSSIGYGYHRPGYGYDPYDDPRYGGSYGHHVETDDFGGPGGPPSGGDGSSHYHSESDEGDSPDSGTTSTTSHYHSESGEDGEDGNDGPDSNMGNSSSHYHSESDDDSPGSMTSTTSHHYHSESGGGDSPSGPDGPPPPPPGGDSGFGGPSRGSSKSSTTTTTTTTMTHSEITYNFLRTINVNLGGKDVCHGKNFKKDSNGGYKCGCKDGYTLVMKPSTQTSSSKQVTLQTFTSQQFDFELIDKNGKSTRIPVGSPKQSKHRGGTKLSYKKDFEC